MFNILICGGGVAGAGLACALSNLADQGIVSITVLEKDAKDGVGHVKRGEVIRPEVTKAMEEIEVIDEIKRNNPVLRYSPRQEVWHRDLGLIGTFDYELYARGHPMMYLPHALIVKSLYEKIGRVSNITTFFKSEAINAGLENGKPLIAFRHKETGDEEKLSADLVVVADGGASNIRGSLGIELDFFDYNLGYLMAILAKPPEIEWGRHCLSPNGFVGLFSMPGNLMRAAIEIETKDLREWLSLSKSDLTARLEARVSGVEFFKVREIGVFYHVLRRHAARYAPNLGNFVLIGDAAHTTHPMMGQGMSMVFHDILALSRLIENSPTASFGEREITLYEKNARPFNECVISNNDKLHRSFQEIGREPEKLEDELPFLKGIGFEKVKR